METEGDGEFTKDLSKSTISDVELPTILDETTSTGRFYECIFCKRGFSTAQALGGHMNIHRKDRAKMKRSSSPSLRAGEDESEGGYGYYSNHRCAYPPVSESLKNYSAFLPSGSGSRDTRREMRELTLFGEDLKLGLRVDEEGREVVRSREFGEGEEVDLELRLGMEP